MIDPLPPRSHRTFTDAIVIAFVYLGAAVAFTWPLAASLASRLGAPEGPGDPYLNLWILGWDLQTLTTRPTALFDGTIFNANIFHPAAATLAYSDHLLPQAIALLPLYLVTRDAVVCYNVLLLASFVASSLAMHALVRKLGASRAAAVIAGLAWAFWPYRISHLIHLQLQALYFLPLILLVLHRTIARARRSDAVWLGVLTALQTLSSLYYGVMAAMAIAVGVVCLGIGTGRLRSTRLLSRLALAVLVGALVVAPIVWPYWRMQRDEGFARNLYEASRHAAVVAELHAGAGDELVVRPDASADGPRCGRPGAAGPVDGVEQALFPGAVAGAARERRVRLDAATGDMAGRMDDGSAGARRRGPFAWDRRAFGPIYAAFHEYVFGFQAVRAPARFAVLVTARARGACRARGHSPAGGEGYRRLARSESRLPGCASSTPRCLGHSSIDRRRATAVGQWLASQAGQGAVLYLPLTNDRRNTRRRWWTRCSTAARS